MMYVVIDAIFKGDRAETTVKTGSNGSKINFSVYVYSALRSHFHILFMREIKYVFF